jgi:ribosomal-protein-alanine N-acetyltransferase
MAKLKLSRDENLAFNVRLMRKEDLPQVTEIDREAFPTLWPPANYQRELDNRLAYYIVACDEEERFELPEPKATPQKGFSGLTAKLRQLFNHNRFLGNEPPPSVRQYIFGFAGFWIMAGEVHITNIAVREQHRRQGIGELLLISLIDLGIELGARLITLEVRSSNIAAQSLYSKYGFNQVGLRRGYYTDNREDGVLMSIEDITSALVEANLQQLKQAHAQKWGITVPHVAL